MRSILIISLVSLALPLPVFAENEGRVEHPLALDRRPEFSSLLEWLDFLQPGNARLLKAADQAGYYIAVFKDGDGDLVFCHHEKRGTDTADFVVSVTDDSGRNLTDQDSQRTRHLHRLFAIPADTGNGIVIVLWNDGSIFPLVEEPPERLRVVFEVSPTSDGDRVTAFDEMVDWR
jgi:hypothetical protein